MNINTLQLQRTSNGLVKPNQNIFFNGISHRLGDAIEYNFSTAEITINKKGIYYINWRLAIREYYPRNNNLEVNLIISNNSSVSSTNNNCDLIGYNILNVNNPPVVLSLRNTSSNVILRFTSRLVIKASLLVTEATDLKGEQGPTGPIGPQGLSGPIGIQGLQGPQGIMGKMGPTGLQGIQGEIGPAGSTGAEGPMGPQGVTGSQGPAGIQGATGITGSIGPQGVTGATGPQGLQGLPGAGVTDYAYIYQLATSNNATILGGDDIVFSDNEVLSGVSHMPGDTIFMVNNSGLYFIEYSITYTVGQGAKIGIAINGNVIASTIKSLESNGGNLSGCAIINLDSTDEISVKNYSTTSLTISQSPSVGAQLNILRIV